MKNPILCGDGGLGISQRLNGCTDLTVLNHELDWHNIAPTARDFISRQLKKYRPDEQVLYISDNALPERSRACEKRHSDGGEASENSRLATLWR